MCMAHKRMKRAALPHMKPPPMAAYEVPLRGMKYAPLAQVSENAARFDF